MRAPEPLNVAEFEDLIDKKDADIQTIRKRTDEFRVNTLIHVLYEQHIDTNLLLIGPVLEDYDSFREVNSAEKLARKSHDQRPFVNGGSNVSASF